MPRKKNCRPIIAARKKIAQKLFFHSTSTLDHSEADSDEISILSGLQVSSSGGKLQNGNLV